MGVGGNFWDILKPYARCEGFDFLRNKRVAVDLSFWIVQHETAIKSNVRNSHLRLTFFRTIILFSKFGAFPVFVIDGTPSPLKSQARIGRFFRSSGVDLSDVPAAEAGVSVERNGVFKRCVEECVELLKLLGMPVIKAKGEAEALCAELNQKGVVDACITADSDSFLYGAKCVIKCFHSNSKEPFECYHMTDIDTGLGLKRQHLIAISLLVGNDHDLNGVQGIGLDTAVRFVKCFTEDEVLNRLQEIGSGTTTPVEEDGILFTDDSTLYPDKIIQKKLQHCSLCGHPGTKTAHQKNACEYCSTTCGNGCSPKPAAYKCVCSSCDMYHKEREQKKKENWHMKVCNKIAGEKNFPNNEIIDMYCCDKNAIDDSLQLSWESPITDMVVDFLVYHQRWEPSYIRLRMLPMLSTIFLREMALNPTGKLLFDQYKFDSVQRVKIRYSHQFYVVKWTRPSSTIVCNSHPVSCHDSASGSEEVVPVESIDVLDEPDVPQVHVDDGSSFLLTDENMDLVQGAFPDKVNSYLQKKVSSSQEAVESNRKKKNSSKSKENHGQSESPNSKGVQLALTNYYPSTKFLNKATQADHMGSSPKRPSAESSKPTSKGTCQNLPKSVRRRLLFD